MEELKPTGGASSAPRKKTDPTPILFTAALICLFIFPALLLFLVPATIVAYVNRLSPGTPGVPKPQQSKQKDARRGPLTVCILGVGILFVSLSGGGTALLMIGICTGGVIWAPFASYLIARLVLFGYDRMTQQGAQSANSGAEVSDPITTSPTTPTVNTTKTQIPPNFSLLSPTDQSLVTYIIDARARGVTAGEISILLKSNGWLDEDIAHGFELVYYPGA